jgi:NodT family efflux transporter outer membrane factor (OMF) lipoprotein
VAALAAQYRTALANLGVSEASRYPTVTGTLSGTQSQGTSAGGGAIVSGAPITNAVRLSFSTSWEVDLWGKISRTIESNRALADAAQANMESTLLSAQLTLTQNYIQLRAIDLDAQHLDQTVKAYERALNIYKEQYDVGVAARSAVVQAQSQLDTARAQREDLGVQRAQFEHAIAVLTGKPPSSFQLQPTYQLPTLPAPPATLPSALLERRPDIANAERLMVSTNALVGVAATAFFPTVTLGATTGFQNNSINDLLNSNNNYWSIGPSIAFPIFNLGAFSAKKAAIANYDNAVANYKQIVLNAFQEVEDNLASQRVLQQEVRIQESAVAAATETFELTRNQYDAGTVSYVNVATAEIAALAARKTLSDLRGRQLLSNATLLKAVAGDWR